MAKPPAQPYYPSPVPSNPEDLRRYLESEFYRLKLALDEHAARLDVLEL